MSLFTYLDTPYPSDLKFTRIILLIRVTHDSSTLLLWYLSTYHYVFKTFLSPTTTLFTISLLHATQMFSKNPSMHSDTSSYVTLILSNRIIQINTTLSITPMYQYRISKQQSWHSLKSYGLHFPNDNSLILCINIVFFQ